MGVKVKSKKFVSLTEWFMTLLSLKNFSTLDPFQWFQKLSVKRIISGATMLMCAKSFVQRDLMEMFIIIIVIPTLLYPIRSTTIKQNTLITK